MDPKALAGAVEGAAAVLPVHLYGLPVDLPAILAVAGDAGVPVVEDAAQAHGATVTMPGGQVRRAGAVGRLAAFSFYPGKNLGAFGDAGAVTTDDDELADRVARLRDGRTSKYEHAEVGWGERLDALQAAVLAVKLKRLEAGNTTRERLARRYDEALAGVGDLVPPPRVEGRTSAGTSMWSGPGTATSCSPPAGPPGSGPGSTTPSPSTCSRPGATSASPAATCPRPRPGPTSASRSPSTRS